jgi:uncharacterized membrane protein
MNVVIAAATAVLMVMVATGIYNLQTWLEDGSYRRHFYD